MPGLPIEYFLMLSALLFSIGLTGVLLRKNAIVVLLCVELMLNAVNLSFIAFAHHHQNEEGLMFSFFVIALAAAEAVIGLSIILAMFRQKNTVELTRFSSLNS